VIAIRVLHKHKKNKKQLRLLLNIREPCEVDSR
jgi:hypothetical protein